MWFKWFIYSLIWIYYTHISGIVRGYNAEVNDFNQAYSLSCQGSFPVLYHVHRWLLARNVPWWKQTQTTSGMLQLWRIVCHDGNKPKRRQECSSYDVYCAMMETNPNDARNVPVMTYSVPWWKQTQTMSGMFQLWRVVCHDGNKPRRRPECSSYDV